VYSFREVEEKVLSFWKNDSTFEKSLLLSQETFVFYDGPPFATGIPHYGHLLVGTIKDVIARYKTMSGFSVPRKWGWDCHGVPVEALVQKKMGLGRTDIVSSNNVEEFNRVCRESVLTCADQWRETVSRMGRWVSFDDSYKTMDSSYMESVWWVFKNIYEQGRIYKAKKIMPYSCKLQTTLSNFEIANSYRNVEDPYVIVKFRIVNSDFSLLVYTTTPWTLPSNAAVCLNPNISYSEVLFHNEKYIVATSLVDKLFDESITLRTMIGSDLLGAKYHSLFSDEKLPIVNDTYVSSEEGTGAVHLAPLFGEDDYRIGVQHNLSMIDPLDVEGRFIAGDYAPLFCKDADKKIIEDLSNKGVVFKSGTIRHDYPFCERTSSPLIYRAIDAWYVRVEDIKDRLLANNDTIKWVPESIGENRFANWLREAKDWNVSRNRLWGSCLPLWQAEDGETICIGSIKELEELSGEHISDLHKDVLDKVIFNKNGKTFRRVPEVLDCWFESGCMPYAQHHYPFENKEKVENNFPADFIVEGLDQTRGWFYTLLIISTLLFDKAPFKNVIVSGLVLSEDGTKMSKSKNNFADVSDIIDNYGADVLRAYLLSSPAVSAEPFAFKEKELSTINKCLLFPMTNVLTFFHKYVSLDNWKDNGNVLSPIRLLDKWILSRLKEVVIEVDKRLSSYELTNIFPTIYCFLDDLCNWYIRLSRRFFYKENMSPSKDQAFRTLHYVLHTLCQLLAPFIPFISEYIFSELGESESIHLSSYPKVVSLSLEEESYIFSMRRVRLAATLGHNLRTKAAIKVRVPLAKMIANISFSSEEIPLLKEELNVKEIEYSGSLSEKRRLSAKANFKRLGRRCGKQMSNVASAIANLSSEELEALKEAPINILSFEISYDDVLVSETFDSTLPMESSNNVVVLLDTTLNKELIEEGDIREICSFIQGLRKAEKLNVFDNIRVHFSASSNESKDTFLNNLSLISSQVRVSNTLFDSSLSDNGVEISSGTLSFAIKKD
jgi:isoleucyl-tRNA synthetase